MSIRYWLAKVGRRKQTVTVTVTGYDAATTYKITMGVNVVSVLGTGGSAAATASALYDALAATEFGEFKRVSWSYPGSGAVITGQSVESGEPFTATSSVSGGAGTIGAVTTTVTNLSPNDVADANNWSGATLPVSGDSIVADATAESMLWNLDAFAAVDIASARFLQGFTGSVGLPVQNENDFVEYRPTELQFQSCTLLYEEQGSGLDAAGRKYNVGANACAATFVGDGSGSLESEVTWFRGTNAGNTASLDAASVLFSPLESASATVATLSAVNGSVVRGGKSLATITTFVCTNSQFDLRTNVTTLTVNGPNSAWVLREAAAVTTFNCWAGTGSDLSSGTYTTLVVGTQTNPAVIDFSGIKVAKSVTNLVNVYAGSTINDPDKRVTWGAGVTIPNGSYRDITADFGIGRTYAISG